VSPSYRSQSGADVIVRTGQAHRTLTGHTAPVTCLQFDEMNIVTGSLDKTIRVGAPGIHSFLNG
jgi:WD40 repeat protein